MFVTLFYALLDPANGAFTYVNAGHNPPLVCREGNRSRGERPALLMPTGMALGVLEDAPLEQRTLHLEPGDWVLLYTDGITEAMNAQGELFGEERLFRVLEAHCHRTATEVLDALESAIDEYAGGAAQSDDIAMMMLKRV
jgi:sigma-B regulation protein RsbU (phosphoserine phosphatase)